MSIRILVVDDDPFLLQNIVRLLKSQGFDVSSASNGEEALQLIADLPPNLMVLDLGLPGVDGISLCRRIRAKWRFPVLMLTARTDAMDKVIGLEVGADDYITKPFEPAELLARIRAQLRRATEYQERPAKFDTRLSVGPVEIDFGLRDARLAGKLVGLTAKEFDLLAYMAKNAGRALKREMLFEQVWGYEMEFNSNSLDVFVYRLRQKLEDDPSSPRMLQTVRGYGYLLKDGQATAQ